MELYRYDRKKGKIERIGKEKIGKIGRSKKIQRTGQGGNRKKKKRTLSGHPNFIPCAFSAFPEAAAAFGDDDGMTVEAVFGPVWLFAGAVAAKWDKWME